MEVQKIEQILIYNINKKDKIIGILRNISKNEILGEIRPQIRKMNENDEFILYKGTKEIETIDKEIEDDFTIEDILINENEKFKIYINGLNKIDLNDINNNSNSNMQKQNKQIQNNNNNRNNIMFNNSEDNIFNQFSSNKYSNNINFINPMINNMNSMNNMNKKKSMNNNMKNINNVNNMNLNYMNNINNMNMNNMNSMNMNYMNNIDNMNNINNMNNMNMNNINNMNNMNMNNINHMNNINNMNPMNNMNMNNINNINNMNMNNINNMNNTMNIWSMNNLNKNVINNDDDFNEIKDTYNPQIKKYNVTFKVSSGLVYSLEALYFEKIYCFIDRFLSEINNLDNKDDLCFLCDKKDFENYKTRGMYFDNIKDSDIYQMMRKGLIFDKVKDLKEEKEKVEYYFKNEPNPIIFVIDIRNLIKLIYVIFNDNHGNNIKLIANYYTRMNHLFKNCYIDELDMVDPKFYSERNDFNKCFEFKYKGKNIELDFNKYDDIPIVGDYFLNNFIEENYILIDVKDKKNFINIMYITFKDNHGDQIKIISNKLRSIRELIEKYLYKINRIDDLKFRVFDDSYPFQIDPEIKFYYNQKSMSFNDDTLLRDYFKNEDSPIIEVDDYLDILLSEPIYKYEITFEVSQKFSVIIYSFVGSKMETIINNYLNYIEHPELINDKTKIIFLYKGEKIDTKMSARKCFKNESNPKILVMDTNNILKDIFINKPLPKINIIFRFGERFHRTLCVNRGTTIDSILKKYLWSENFEGFIGHKNKIAFIFNAKNIRFGDQTPAEEFFKHDMLNVQVNDQLDSTYLDEYILKIRGFLFK